MILGASNKPDRPGYIAAKYLHNKGFQLLAIASKKSMIDNSLPIETTINPNEKIDTLSIYLNPDNQKKYYNDILQLKPRQIIFNPGTYNKELEKLALENNIQVMIGCTVAMLAGL